MASSVPVPSVVAPSKKVTVPAGVPEEAVTAAVNVIAWPKAAGFDEVTTVVVVGAATMTLCDRAAEALPAKFVSPAYEAVME